LHPKSINRCVEFKAESKSSTIIHHTIRILSNIIGVPSLIIMENDCIHLIAFFSLINKIYSTITQHFRYGSLSIDSLKYT
jgi:hypothetical protein